jgi:hypothetical protein
MSFLGGEGRFRCSWERSECWNFLYSLTPDPDPEIWLYFFLGLQGPDAVCIPHRVTMAPRVSMELPVALESQALQVSQGRLALLAK